MAEHDHGYKLLFSHPRMVEDLLRGFIGKKWVSRLDFGTLERVNSSLISEDFKERRNDVIWRLRWADGEEGGWFYLYLLLEFQSKSDRFMALRLLVYVGLLLQQLIRTDGLTPSGKLPPILPAVLYNGRRAWQAPQNLLSLFAAVPPGLRRYLPRLEYLLVDENRLTKEEKEQENNLAAALFRLEACDEPEEFSVVTSGLAALIPEEEETGLRRELTAWVLQVLHRAFPGATIPGIEDLKEVPMLEENLRRWRDAAWKDGVREGRQEGLQEGLRTTHRLLLRQMERRFGPIPKRVRAKVETISSMDELERLADELLVAKSLKDLGLG
jgi:predicted transposase YdaD